MLPEIQATARETVEALVDQGACEFTTTFADRYPVRVFLASMGLSTTDDADFFVSCVRRLSLTDADEVGRERRRCRPGTTSPTTGPMSSPTAGRTRSTPTSTSSRCSRSRELGGERPVPDDEIRDICVTLTIGSLDTLKSQLGWCFYHLATHPEDRRRIVADPSLTPGAVEEFLRAYPIVSMARKLTRDVDFHGCPMKKDQMVLVSNQSACRDPRMFPNAGRRDHRPQPQPPHRLRGQRAPLPRLAPRPSRAAGRHRRVARG